MKLNSVLLALSALPLSLVLPAHAENIGVSMARFDSTFLTLLRNGMEARAAELGDVTLQVEDAVNDPSTQLNQVSNFIASGVDAIIIAAVDAESTPGMSALADAAGIPIVYANHPPADIDALPEKGAFVGSNEVDSGTLQTREVCQLLGGSGNVLILMGPLNNHSALQRTKDVHDVIATDDCKGMSVLEEQTANWDRLEAANLMTNWLSSSMEFDAVIANNDEMAIGAIQALKSVGRDMDGVVVAGVDATPDGLAAMAAGDLDVTVFQNAQAQGAASVDAAIALARGEATEQKIWVPFELVTPENMAEYQNKN
ncbi:MULTISPECIES: sugar ABC transporter substrate-binding protein [unclassified Devosia]|uniref:sugar ABC transporter substrate-binding protein n=1 Tax=unclassified Devosia TaxID=196773 RepID=UPI000FD8A2C7|nr:MULTISPECIES: sugar ABC transporter substrate-binding protein [unclassified Devosia]